GDDVHRGRQRREDVPAVIDRVADEGVDLGGQRGEVGVEDRLLLTGVRSVHALDDLLLHVGDEVGDRGRDRERDGGDAAAVGDALGNGAVSLDVAAEALGDGEARSVVDSAVDLEARRYALLDLVHVTVGTVQELQGDLCRDVCVDRIDGHGELLQSVKL